MDKFRKVVLDNGIRIVTEKIPYVKSVSLGLWVNAGSRNENEKESGISHFIEHMFFKGTSRRSAKDIAITMDSIGGELNAFTSREATTYYSKVLDTHLREAVDLLSDIFLNSLFDEREIEKEKQVILEEIKMVEDTPDDYIHDLYTHIVWPKHSLGRPILGNLDTVAKFKRKGFKNYLEKNYCPKNIVIAVAGNFDFKRLIRLLDRNFGKLERPETINFSSTPEIKGGIFVKKKKLEQIHICLGTRGLSHVDKDRYGLYALNTMLGSSMSSRLFQEIREKRGLVYSIYSYIASFRDTGLFTVYAGTSHSSVLEVIRLILREFRSMKEKKASPSELNKALEHMKGNLMLSLESTSSRMSKIAKDEIYFNRYISYEEIIRNVNKVTAKQVKRIANEIFDRKALTLTAIGDLSKNDIDEDMLRC
ncbi:MAG: insulinase family protein [Nitrospirae bacterium]|nr:insulinase family protein [Nitrospirota bacterium]